MSSSDYYIYKIRQNNITQTYIFDFNQNLDNQNIQVYFYDWIRGVKKFSSIKELKEQISKDISVAFSFFKTK